MNEARLLELFAEIRNRDHRAALSEGTTSHPGGLTLSRARALVLNPARWMKEERDHVDNCHRCAHLIKSFERNMEHPSLWVLARSLLGRLRADEAQLIKYHVEDGECRRCLGLTQSHWLQGMAKAARGARRTQEQIEATSESFAAAFGLLPARVGAFDPTTRPPFRVRALSSDESLAVTLRETSRGDLVAHVKTPDPERHGKKARVEVVGKGQSLIAEVVLEAQGERGCAGRYTFGSFAELAPRLGAGCTVLAALTEEDG